MKIAYILQTIVLKAFVKENFGILIQISLKIVINNLE